MEINPYEQAKINSWAAEAMAFLGTIRHLSDECNDLFNRAPTMLHAIHENDLVEIERINQLWRKYSREEY